jgi:regulation of enolase protein 1 (concanavalin A-like superfamily)
MRSVSKKIFILTFSGLTVLFNNSFPQNFSLGIFKDHSDIGNVELPGSAIYNPENQEYVLEGSGYNIWFERDEFHYLWQKAKGDFVLKARVEFIGKGIEPHRKIGWMIRNDLSTGSPHVSAVVHGDGLTSLQYRDTADSVTKEVKSEDQAPDFIQLERKGNHYYMSTASGKMPLKTVQIENINLNNKVLVGLFICSHNPGVTEKAIFRQVKISRSGKKKQS